MASAARRQLATGEDPADARRQERAATAARIEAEQREAKRRDNLVEAVLARYFRLKVEGMKSAYELKRLLSVELAPWAARRVDSISRADAIKLIDDIAERGHKVTANRVRTKAGTFFSWCRSKALVEANPFADTEPAVAEKSRDRVLSDDELRLLTKAMDSAPPLWRAFFRLALLTGQRRNEVAGMRWLELNLNEAAPVWTIPAARTKNGREHVVPLSPQAVTIIRSLPNVQIMGKSGKLRDSDLVLTTTGVTALGGFSKAKGRLDAAFRELAGEDAEIKQWQLHDFRRTMATSMARLRVDIVVIEKVLNHVSGTMAGVAGVYQRHEYADEKRAAMIVWANHLDDLHAPQASNVIPMQREA
jgi:integrase